MLQQIPCQSQIRSTATFHCESPQLATEPEIQEYWTAYISPGCHPARKRSGFAPTSAIVSLLRCILTQPRPSSMVWWTASSGASKRRSRTIYRRLHPVYSSTFKEGQRAPNARGGQEERSRSLELSTLHTRRQFSDSGEGVSLLARFPFWLKSLADRSPLFSAVLFRKWRKRGDTKSGTCEC